MPPSTMMINTPCTIVRRVEVDEGFYTDEDETLVDTVCELQQTQREEPAAAGEMSRDTFDVFFLPDAPVFHTGDGLLVDMFEYEFTGSPWEARNSRTQTIGHIEATVVRTAGTGDEDAS